MGKDLEPIDGQGKPQQQQQQEDQQDEKLEPTKTEPHREVLSAQVTDVLTLLLVFRFLNAICVRTFFQPDEYFQALEPAWKIAFGGESGAWLTWVCTYHIHSLGKKKDLTTYTTVTISPPLGMGASTSLVIAPCHFWPGIQSRSFADVGPTLPSTASIFRLGRPAQGRAVCVCCAR